MLDQSFSAKNFRKIFDSENRKGVYLASRFFPEVHNKSNIIKECNVALKALKRPTDDAQMEAYRAHKKNIRDAKSVLEGEKEALLAEALEAVSSVVTKKDFTIPLGEKDLKNKKMYIPACSTADYSGLQQQDRNQLAAQYFALKQVQRNIQKLYKVKQADRHNIVCQLREVLKEKFPKYVVKTDISSFYEGIPRERIIKKIYADNLLSYRSKKIIKQIFYEYGKETGRDEGIPRGIGISSYLSELYMRDFDEAVQNSSNIIYYARYVDDIIAVYTPEPSYKSLKEISKTIKEKGLLRNKKKTLIIKDGGNTNYFIDYLGYSFKFQNGDIQVRLTKPKEDKYKKKIDLTFDAYKTQSQYNEKKARRLLVKRIKFLTGNTRLVGNKKNIRVGIYFSNKILTDPCCLRGIDCYLTYKRTSSPINNKTQTRLASLSFKTGFKEKVFYKFSKKDLEEIMKVWKYDQ